MIDLLPDEEQQQIIDSAVDFLQRTLPMSRLRPGGAGPRAELSATWTQVAGLGWFGIGLPESSGGVGYSLIEEMLIARELGRFVVSPAVVGGMIAAHLVCSAIRWSDWQAF